MSMRIYSTVLASIAWLVLSMFSGSSGVAKADIIVDFAQQSGVAEETSRRAVYLGRLFNGIDGGPFRLMESMYAAVTVAQARQQANVKLFAGDGNSNFDNSFAQGRMFDTGIQVINAEQDRTETLFIPGSFTPGLLGPTDPFRIAEQPGTAIFNSLATNRRLDFWLVGDANSGFTVPSSVAGDPAFFIVQFQTAVPEPTSIALAGTGIVFLAFRLRTKRTGKKSSNSEVR